ncbi:MAG: hypothetical protein LPD71_07255 [Shewanella sp.]|nr:hypothetical protein [Shewanella sp.]MCF1430137.1 hypothetical protein [Shewanella sp.]MCF1438536.1 hypothetical protein [Shewanella sp.]MCF1458822.1 hypothetical protein [Shewanella sp.]
MVDSSEAAAHADVSRIEAELTQTGESASVAPVRAKLDLARTQIKALSAGTVSNLQLQSGGYVGEGSPVPQKKQGQYWSVDALRVPRGFVRTFPD